MPQKTKQNRLQTAIQEFQAGFGEPDRAIPQDFTEYEEALTSTWENCDDLKKSVLKFADRRVLLAWLHGIVDKQRIQIGLLRPLSQQHIFHESAAHLQDALAAIPLTHLESMQQVSQYISDGCVVLYEEGTNFALSVDLSNMPGKPIGASQSEPVIEGPQEAFTESLEMNMAMLRKRLRNPRFKIETHQMGKVTQTSTAIFYIEDIATEELLTEVRTRLSKIEIDSILDTNYLREMMSDAPWSPFPTMASTERPDKLIAGLLQGRVCILPHGATHALMVPTLFMQFLTASEDMYSSYYVASLIRILRHILFWASMLLPSIYVALILFHKDLIPTPLLISLMGQHAGIPFPTWVEAFLMQFSFEALREAGQRLPRGMGQSVSIVGSLVIGDAAVQAGIVSPGVVIVVATTGIASFTIADYALVNTSRVLQFMFLLCGSVLGLYGVTIALLLVVIHLTSIRSFGVPYMTPFAPFDRTAIKDSVVRAPWWMIRKRPSAYGSGDRSNRTPKPGPTKN